MPIATGVLSSIGRTWHAHKPPLSGRKVDDIWMGNREAHTSRGHYYKICHSRGQIFLELSLTMAVCNLRRGSFHQSHQELPMLPHTWDAFRI
jgi:hypothetical protein